MKKPTDLICLTLKLHSKMDNAILVSETGDKWNAVWLPLYLCEIERVSKVSKGIINVTLPEKLARAKGLI